MKRILQISVALLSTTLLLSTTGCFFTSPPPTAACTGDSDCAAGFICSQGSCVDNSAPQCTADTDCNAGFVCNAGACVEAAPPPACTGDLVIAWEFEGSATCPDDVDDVVIKVIAPDGSNIHQTPNGDVFACSQGEQVFRNLPCGTYQISVGGIDDADEFTWSAPSTNVDVVDGRAADITADLEPE
jgi:Cys-rich repeat protein